MKDLDKFYTKKEIALKCYEFLCSFFLKKDLNKFLFIEPSAGAGDFLFPLMKENYKFIAFDILPGNKNIYKEDFLKLNISNYINNYNKENIIVIGNPPFGTRAKQALNFFIKSSFFSDTIAMIFPLQFQKWSIQKNIPIDFKLIGEYLLDEKSFYKPNNTDYKVRTVFQVRTRLDLGYKDLRIKEKPIISIDDFDLFLYNNTKQSLKYFDKNKYGWEFAIPRQGFYDFNIKIYNEKDLNPKIQWMFVKPKTDLSRKLLYHIDYSSLAKKNTIIPGFGKADIIEEYLKLKKKVGINYESFLMKYGEQKVS